MIDIMRSLNPAMSINENTKFKGTFQKTKTKNRMLMQMNSIKPRQTHTHAHLLLSFMRMSRVDLIITMIHQLITMLLVSCIPIEILLHNTNHNDNNNVEMGGRECA